MAKLINVYRSQKVEDIVVKKRQLPIKCSDNQIFMMDLGHRGFSFDRNFYPEKEKEAFDKKVKIMSREEFRMSLQVTRQQFTQILSISVPCVGCRRSVERLLEQLIMCAYPTIYPITIHSNGNISITVDSIRDSASVGIILFNSDRLLNELVEHQPRSKKSSRCSLHSLDSFRSRPFSEIWCDVWSSMSKRCREDISIIEANDLHIILDNYLKKHKFCSECRTKVEKAYALLVKEDSNLKKEQGYVPSLYAGIKRCVSKKHIHLLIKYDYIDNLIKKAEPELNGSQFRHRERHAKTMEVAQEEVLTCIGICIYEKLRRIHVCLKEEENACQVLASVAVFALSRNFDMAVENKRGVSKLELLFEELSREEKLKEERKEQKKLKKRKKRNERRRRNSCENYSEVVLVNSISQIENKINIAYTPDDIKEDILNCCEISNVIDPEVILHNNADSCHSCNTEVQHSLDAGYSSETHHEGVCSRLSSSEISASSSISSSPEGSEVACSDGFCNHNDSLFTSSHIKRTTTFVNSACKSKAFGTGTFKLSLAQMLDEAHYSDEDACGGIPDELILEFQSRHAIVKKEREELRKRLVNNFNRLCASAYAKEH